MRLTAEDRTELSREPNDAIRTAYRVLASQEIHFNSLLRCPIPGRSQATVRKVYVNRVTDLVILAGDEAERLEGVTSPRATLLRGCLVDLHDTATRHFRRILDS